MPMSKSAKQPKPKPKSKSFKKPKSKSFKKPKPKSKSSKKQSVGTKTKTKKMKLLSELKEQYKNKDELGLTTEEFIERCGGAFKQKRCCEFKGSNNNSKPNFCLIHSSKPFGKKTKKNISFDEELCCQKTTTHPWQTPLVQKGRSNSNGNNSNISNNGINSNISNNGNNANNKGNSFGLLELPELPKRHSTSTNQDNISEELKSILEFANPGPKSKPKSVPPIKVDEYGLDITALNSPNNTFVNDSTKITNNSSSSKKPASTILDDGSITNNEIKRREVIEAILNQQNKKYDGKLYRSYPSTWYELALNELQADQKHEHWMWFIFPTLKVLRPGTSKPQFLLPDFNTALYFLNNKVLLQRLIQCLSEIRKHNKKIADFKGFGKHDSDKFIESISIFIDATILNPDTLNIELLELLVYTMKVNNAEINQNVFSAIIMEGWIIKGMGSIKNIEKLIVTTQKSLSQPISTLSTKIKHKSKNVLKIVSHNIGGQ